MVEALVYIPLEMDLALHAAPAISLTLDFFLFESKYNRKATHLLAPLLALSYTVWYSWWAERCGAMNNGACNCLSSLAYSWKLIHHILSFSSISFPNRQSFSYSASYLYGSRPDCTFFVPASQ